MENKQYKRIFAFSIIFYIIAIGLMAFGTVSDLKIDLALFNPENMVAKYAESFSQFVYWGMWGPAFAVIFLCRRDLNESLAVINKLLPIVKPVSNTENKAYKFFNLLLKCITAVAFFALTLIGVKKLVENLIKNILFYAGKDDLSQAFYFILCAVLSVLLILALSRIDKAKLRKIEALALAGVLLGIFYKIVEECKEITGRVRFREMVAYSNNIFNEKGLTNGQKGDLTKEMVNNTDFSHYVPWYKHGDSMDGIYAHSNSFPSGHTTYCCTIFMSYPLCLAFNKLKKLAPFAYLISTLYVILIGFTRMVAGAHYLTDVAGAAIIGYTLFIVVFAIYNKFTKKEIIG